jgi:hypothetical protein
MTRLCETPEAAARLLGDHRVLSLLASTAVPGAEYLLVLRTERSFLMLAGAPEASEQLEEALTPSTVDSQIFHVRLNANKVTVAGINEVRAACLAEIDWRLHLETIRHANAADKPLRVVRRAGHPIVSGVIARRVGHGPDQDRRLVGQLSVPDALTALDRSRAWHLITTAAAEDVGRPVRPSDDITVNEMPASRLTRIWRNGSPHPEGPQSHTHPCSHFGEAGVTFLSLRDGLTFLSKEETPASTKLSTGPIDVEWNQSDGLRGT